VTYATREMLLKPIERPSEIVELPELGEGVSVLVTGMTAKERSDFDTQFTSRKGEPMPKRVAEGRERLVVACCRNEASEKLFTTDDVVQLGKQSVVLIERIVKAAQRVSGIGENDLEDAAKNLEETQGD
jgi:hypothetical protein